MLLREISEKDYEKIGRLFTSKLGIEVLGILDKTFYHTISFTSGKPDETNFKEGQRDLVQVIRNAAEAVEKKEIGE